MRHGEWERRSTSVFASILNTAKGKSRNMIPANRIAVWAIRSASFALLIWRAFGPAFPHALRAGFSAARPDLGSSGTAHPSVSWPDQMAEFRWRPSHHTRRLDRKTHV